MIRVSPGQSGKKLTVLIPCKNEQKNIRPCIEAVRPIADEILVADSGSTDGTLDIVQELGGCRIIRREYVNSADFKNWAIPQAAHAWVFIVDADERVPEGLVHEINQLLQAPPEHLDAYSCAFQDFFMGHPLKYARWDTRSIRLIRRDVCRYRARRVHSDIDIDSSRVGKLNTEMLHYGFWTYDDFIQKRARYTHWASQDLWDKGKRASFYSLLIRPMLRFLHMYIIRRGFLDGLPGLQVCMVMSFFNTFFKQARLWHLESAIPQPDPEADLQRRTILQHPAVHSSPPNPHLAVTEPEIVRKPVAA